VCTALQQASPEQQEVIKVIAGGGGGGGVYETMRMWGVLREWKGVAAHFDTLTQPHFIIIIIIMLQGPLQTQ
jgi:hypothetical protein